MTETKWPSITKSLEDSAQSIGENIRSVRDRKETEPINPSVPIAPPEPPKLTPLPIPTVDPVVEKMRRWVFYLLIYTVVILTGLFLVRSLIYKLF